MTVPDPVSATVAVQVEAEFTGTEDGEQFSVVEVGRVVGDSEKLIVRLLPLVVLHGFVWGVNPEADAVMFPDAGTLPDQLMLAVVYTPDAFVVVDGGGVQPEGDVQVMVIVAPLMAALVAEFVTVPVTFACDATLYGPTKGPPSPTGGAPAGTTGSVEVSFSARLRLTRPFPVSPCAPAGSAFRASRPTS